MYGIQKVAQIIGITPITLRAWENRYGVIKPARTNGGTRIYSEQDLEELIWVVEQRNTKKLTVKQAMALLQAKKDTLSTIPLTRASYSDYTTKVFNLLSNFQAKEATLLLDELIKKADHETIFHHILAPALIKVGEHWENKTLTVAQEHFISHYIQQAMAQHFYAFEPSHYLGKAISVCPPNEMHQIGLLLFSLFLKRRNIDVMFIGQDTPITDILLMIETEAIDLACFSITLSSHMPNLVELLDQLARHYPQVEIVIGGPSAQKLPENYQAFYMTGNLDDWEDWFSNRFKRNT
ncbi:B12 binding domain-containing protein [Amphibacillus marinus]|uniref:B12 binding domain-containing protein n=1 Tax=Amphibacillus marinus TaxID=872970 RepID=A0A1H8K2T8_9BACI|nr:cobalamin B12-binding domain-containing protein [Amphibacillus marinus]SEN87283.1 B12 binding domain-containing protein [Amphibacillus marinus]